MLSASSPSGTRAIDQPQVFEAASPGHYSRPGLRWAPGAGMCRAQTASPRAAPVPCPRVPELGLASSMGDVEWRVWELRVPPGGLGAARSFWGVLPLRGDWIPLPVPGTRRAPRAGGGDTGGAEHPGSCHPKGRGCPGSSIWARQHRGLMAEQKHLFMLFFFFIYFFFPKLKRGKPAALCASHQLCLALPWAEHSRGTAGDGSDSSMPRGWTSKTTHEVAVDTFSGKVTFGWLDLLLWEREAQCLGEQRPRGCFLM